RLSVDFSRRGRIGHAQDEAQQDIAPTNSPKNCDAATAGSPVPLSVLFLVQALLAVTRSQLVDLPKREPTDLEISVAAMISTAVATSRNHSRSLRAPTRNCSR